MAQEHPQAVRWHGPGEVVLIKGFSIQSGMVYAGDPKYNRSPLPGRFINTNLAVVNNGYGYPAKMGYYPSYEKISGVNRREYLQWLETGRCMGIDIGYVFLFFYGLEERVLGRADDPDEDKEILDEALRLYDRYGANRSFGGYCSAFIDGLRARLVLMGAIPPSPNRVIGADFDVKNALSLRASLHITLSAASALPFDLACAGYETASYLATAASDRKSNVQYHPFTSAERMDLEAEFRKRFPAGFMPQQRALVPLTLSYKTSAQAGLIADFGKGLDLRGVYDLICDDWSTFGVMANEVLGSRLANIPQPLGREMVGQPTHNLPRRFHDWAAEECKPVGIVRISMIVDKLQMSQFDQYLTKANYKFVSYLLAGNGYFLVPTHEEVSARVDLGQLVAIYKSAAAANPAEQKKLSAAFRAVADVAEGEKPLSEKIFEAFSEVITDTLKLNQSDLDQIEARTMLFYERFYDSSDKSLGKLYAGLDEEARQLVAFILTRTLALSVPITPEIINHLEGMYQLFKIPRHLLHTTLHASTSNAQQFSSDVVTAGKEKSRLKSFKIPGKPNDAPTSPAPPPSLNRELISAISADTARVSAALGDIFAEEAAPAVPVSTIHSPSEGLETGPNVPGLSAALSKFLLQIVERPEWPRADISDLAKREGQMLDGAVEALNEWAFDRFDAALIEEGEPYTIALSLLADLPLPT